MKTTIPFAGFYYSIWSEELDQVERSETEYFESDRQAEEGIPKDLRLTACEYLNILSRHSDYSGMYKDAAQVIAQEWASLASEYLEFDLGLTFDMMDSPREYNFATDRIFMSIPRATVAKLYRIAKRDNFENLRRVIKERFTSCDGFISGYSNYLSDWKEKRLSDWDHNEVGTLLIAALAGFDPDENLDLYYRVTDCDGLYHEWSNNVDWPKVEAAIEEAREEKRLEALALDPDFVAPEPRCPLTLELPF